jgi:hypothetical protein
MDAKFRKLEVANVAGKKDDPNYAVVRGHVPADLYKEFKFFCVERNVDNSEGLEQLLKEYFEMKKQKPKKKA